RLTWQPVDRPAELKDRVMIDFVGTVDGEPFSGGSAENFAVILGEQSLLKDFEDGLIGSCADQQIELEVKFPEDYHGQEVAGKLATFNVTVREVAEAVYPELDEEFVKSFGVEDGDIGKLRAEVRENVEREMADRVRRILRQRVFDALIEANEVDLPAALVEAEIDQLIASNKKILERQGVPVGNVNPDRGNFRESAEKRVALGLIMQAVVEKHELKPDAGRVRERVEAIGSGYEDPAAFVQWYYSDRQRMAQMEAMIMEEQLVEKMLEGAEIEDKEISFDELMRSTGE
ncbi:trigger factor, partial [Pseudomonadota bacterium]